MTVYVVVTGERVRVFWRRSEADAVAKGHPPREVFDCEVEGVPPVMTPEPEPGKPQ